MEIFSINKEVINVNRIEELEEKIDRLIEGYRGLKEENERLKAESSPSRAMTEICKGRSRRSGASGELLIEKVQKILEKVERVEI
jgi:hypothetical protein